jgi:hypothetical protein
MIVVGQAGSDGMLSRQSIGDRRRQHAKQIGQGDDPPRLQLVRSGKSDQRLRVETLVSTWIEY